MSRARAALAWPMIRGRMAAVPPVLLVIATACGGKGDLVYPPQPADPADDWPASSPGPDCTGRFPGCLDVKVGTGDPVRAFARMTLRVTIEDTKPPGVQGPVVITFLYPAIDKIPFRGRDRELTTFMFEGEKPERANAEALFARDAPPVIGAEVIGMRIGGTRRLTGLYVGKVGPFKLSSGQSRQLTLDLLEVCYPKIFVTSRLHTTWLDSSGSPIKYDPRLAVEGCGPEPRG